MSVECRVWSGEPQVYSDRDRYSTVGRQSAPSPLQLHLQLRLPCKIARKTSTTWHLAQPYYRKKHKHKWPKYQILRMLRKMKPSRCTAPATTLHFVPTWCSNSNSTCKKNNTTGLKCCACHQKCTWTSLKCCACHEKSYYENPSKTLRLSQNKFSTECDQGPCLQEKTTFQVLPICEITAVFF